MLLNTALLLMLSSFVHGIYHCAFCDYSAKRNLQLTEHIRYRHLKLTYECSSCSKPFSRKQDLTRHERITHTELKGFKCQACGEFFDRSDALNEHIKATHAHQHCLTCAKKVQLCHFNSSEHNQALYDVLLQYSEPEFVQNHLKLQEELLKER